MESPSSAIFLRRAVSLSMEYASAGSRSGAFVGAGEFVEDTGTAPKALLPRLFEADAEAP